MADITEETIIEALTAIRPPDSDKDIVSLGMISGVVLRDGNIAVTIEITQEQGNAFEPTRRQAEETLAALPGVLSATVVLTAQRPAQGASPGAGPGQEQAPLIPNVKTIIAIASGKGGVGKSTTAVNLALAFAAKGLKTGLLDSDIYGPSIPRMLGLEGRPEQISETRLAPKEKFGIKAMSMGLLVADDTPMIWRGPRKRAWCSPPGMALVPTPSVSMGSGCPQDREGTTTTATTKSLFLSMPFGVVPIHFLRWMRRTIMVSRYYGRALRCWYATQISIRYRLPAP